MPLEPNTRCTARLEQGDRVIPVVVSSGSDMSGFYTCIDTAGRILTIHSSNLKSMEPSIPPRFKRTLFNQAAPAIGSALAAWPNAVFLKPDGVTCDTFARRIRDAIEAKKRFGYQNPAINDSEFELRCDSLKVSIEIKPNHVCIGSLEAIRTNDGHLATPMPTRAAVTYFNGTNPQSVEAFILLLHNRLLTPCPQFIITNLTEQQATSLEARYDIGLNPTEENPNNYLVII